MSGVELQTCTAGSWHGAPPRVIAGISTDTRSLCPGEAFLALRGPNFNGHDFAASAVSAGAEVLIGDAAGIVNWQELPVPRLEVNDTLQAFANIAGCWRDRVSACVVAITGSFGKTTLRSMLAHVLAYQGVRVAATRANDNNLIGVPQTLLAIGEDAEVALVECGISERGEMRKLAAMVRPDVAVLTGISAAHAEGLGDMYGVAGEKGILLEYRTDKGCAVLGFGVSRLLPAVHDKGSVLDMDCDDPAIVHWQMDGRCVTLSRGDESASFELPLPAAHLAQDAALAATVLILLGVDSLQRIAVALADWQPVVGRMQVLNGMNGCTILDDSYNANPASMAAALDTLRGMPGRKIAVLGDMAELGADASILHAALDIKNLDVVIAVGEQMRRLGEYHAQVCCAADTQSALDMLAAPAAGDVILVKGSRCMHLEEVVTGLKGNADAV